MNSNDLPISSSNPPLQDDDIGSDSDSSTDHQDHPEYYQPISAVDDEDRRAGSNSDDEHYGYVAGANLNGLDNGYYIHEETRDGISSITLNDDSEEKSGEEDEVEASDAAIVRAFREDERRRNAPLTADNAMRVMEAMQGISFGGLTPEWAGRVPEDLWIDRLRRLRQPPQSHPSSSIQN